ncbi:hypothetical protein AL037_20920 [Salipiger aestuarii]|nr:hypothetical protein AL037_20920 [Salipiger aestuarii]
MVRADKPGMAVASEIDMYLDGKKIPEPDYEKVGNTEHRFTLETCTDKITFKVARISHQYQYEDKFYPCDTPEVQIPVRMYAYAAYVYQHFGDSESSRTQGPLNLGVSWTSAEADPDLYVVPYADRLQATLAAPEAIGAALGETGEKNQAALLEALEGGDFGAVSFYANENAALALQAGNRLLSTRYGTLSYDAGFRDMGVDPAVADLPLVANDEARDIYVMTPEGEQIMEQYHLQSGRSAPATWSSTTTLQLMMDGTTASRQRGLEQLRSTEELRAYQIPGTPDKM